jgi:hypothetical protein
MTAALAVETAGKMSSAIHKGIGWICRDAESLYDSPSW